MPRFQIELLGGAQDGRRLTAAGDLPSVWAEGGEVFRLSHSRPASGLPGPRVFVFRLIRAQVSA